MDVAVIHSDEFKVANMVSEVAASFRVYARSFDIHATDPSTDAPLYIFCSSLVTNEQFRRVRQAVETCDGEKLFVFPTHNVIDITRLKELNLRDYFMMPVDGDALRAAVRRALNRRTEKLWDGLEPATQAALKMSLACFETCFNGVRRGEPLPLDDIYQTSQHILDAVRLGAFDTWIEALANHHNYTFRHSMFVCGTLSYFAHSIGIGDSDLERLTVGGLLHDIGKSMIPVEVLDKPGKLDDADWRIMRNHPSYSREILLREPDLQPDTISMAVHHHEKLDGSGYPDGLCGTQINDSTRLIAIADVYSALIDKRSYKGSMTNEQALDLMATFEGHLDMDLLKAFRRFALQYG